MGNGSIPSTNKNASNASKSTALAMAVLMLLQLVAAVVLLFIRIGSHSGINWTSIDTIRNAGNSSAWAMAACLALIRVLAMLAKVLHWQWQC